MIDRDKYRSMSQEELNSELLNACDNGDLEIISYVLTSPELNIHANIHYSEGLALFCGINQENLEVVKYLLSSSELKEHASIQNKNNQALGISCYLANFELVKFLLSAPELKEHADFFAEKAHFFKLCCEQESYEIIHYLIFEYNLEKTEDIQQYLNAYPSPSWTFLDKVRDMFEMRDFKVKLENSLEEKNNTDNKKIKI